MLLCNYLMRIKTALLITYFKTFFFFTLFLELRHFRMEMRVGFFPLNSLDVFLSSFRFISSSPHFLTLFTIYLTSLSRVFPHRFPWKKNFFPFLVYFINLNIIFMKVYSKKILKKKKYRFALLNFSN